MKAHASPPRSGTADDSREAIPYAELLSRGHDDGLARVRTSVLQFPTEENGRLAVVKAEIETSKGLFEGLGDASPESVEEFLVPHLIRVAETRGKARALRDAVNCGITSLEELDGVAPPRAERPGLGASRRALPVPFRRPRQAPASPAPRRDPAQDQPRSTDGPMSESQRRYLFRILAGHGYEGKKAEEFLRNKLGVPNLTGASRQDASALIDELLQVSPRGDGNGAAHPQP